LLIECYQDGWLATLKKSTGLSLGQTSVLVFQGFSAREQTGWWRGPLVRSADPLNWVGTVFQMCLCKPVTLSVQWLCHEVLDLYIQTAFTDCLPAWCVVLSQMGFVLNIFHIGTDAGK